MYQILKISQLNTYAHVSSLLSHSNNYDSRGIERTTITTRSLSLKKYYQKKKAETIYFDQFSELTVKSTPWARSPFLKLLGIKLFSNIVLVWRSTRSPLELIKNPRCVMVMRSWLKNKYGWGLKRKRKAIMKNIWSVHVLQCLDFPAYSERNEMINDTDAQILLIHFKNTVILMDVLS